MICAWSIALLAWFGASQQAAQSQPADETPLTPSGFLYKVLELDRQKYAYCVYVPPEYTADRVWPVILFLHGSGERGTDGLLQTEVGVARAIRRNRRRVPAIVVMPQCRPGQSWTGLMAKMAIHCVEQTSQEYRLDPRRIYVTGLSLGGQGTWVIGAMLAERAAALAPVCGFGDVRQAAALAKTPIWCFHGALDDKVPAQRSREMVAAIRNAGGDVKYTEYPNAKHYVWDRTYNDPAFWRWLFAQRREADGEESVPAPPTPP